MKLTLFLLAFGIGLQAQDNSGPTAAEMSNFSVPRVALRRSVGSKSNAYGSLPLSFEANRGQTDGSVKFLARVSSYTLFVTMDEAVFSGLDGSVERMKLIGASRKAHVEMLDKQPGISNYFIGNDPSKWRTNVPNYGRAALREVYPGIDLIFYGNQRKLEYDWVVAPGANPKQIRVKCEGSSPVTKNANGDLVLSSGLIQEKPGIVQEGKRIEGGYRVRGREVAFELAKYDTAKPLVIDPVLVYTTHLYGNGIDSGQGIAVDGSGNAYVTGSISSPYFPTTGPIQGHDGGGEDAFVTKINAAGSALVYSTYLGGNEDDVGYGIAVDGSGNAYVTGQTYSTNFPIANPLQASNGGPSYFPDDAFVTKINPAGSALLYSTYLGGDDRDVGYGIAVDGPGNAYVTGYTTSRNFHTANAVQGSRGGSIIDLDAFVTKINAAGSAFVYSTYLGGRGNDYAEGIAVDGSGNAYVTGGTLSTNFPTTHALQASNGGGYDAFVTKINATGSALVYSTYLGGNGTDSGQGIAMDSLGNAYVTGSTTSTNFPTANPLQASFGGGLNFGDAFVTKINAAGSAYVYATYLGGSGSDEGSDIAVDVSGNAYVTGRTDSTDFPTANPLQASKAGGGVNAFVTKINAAGSTYAYSTYLGGSAGDGQGITADSTGNAYVTGQTFFADSGYGRFDPFVLSITESLSSCTYSLSSSGIAYTAQGGSGTITITTNPGCPWTAGDLPAGVVLTSPASGVGSSSLTFQVIPNSGAGQSVSFTIAGQSLTIESLCTYSLSPGGIAFTAQGGSATITITTGPGCPWTAGAPPAGVVLTSPASGTGIGSVTLQVIPNSGADQSVSFTIAGQSLTIEQEATSLSGLNLAGSMAHLAAAESWITSFTLVNKGAAAATARLSLFGDVIDPAGNGPLTLQLAFPQQAATSLPRNALAAAGPLLLAASFDRTLAANASLIVNTVGSQTSPVLLGSAQLAATGAVDGFAIFHQIVTTQEAVVPMETRNASSYLLTFDNTAGASVGVAVQNVSATPATIPIMIRDETGVALTSPGVYLPLAAYGHKSLVLPEAIALTRNIRGTIEFDTPQGGQISVLGLRFTPPNNALTTIPALANVGTGGGSIAHLASGGDGWQTTFVLVNTGTSAATFTLSFFADQTGVPMSLPLAFTQPNGGTDTVAPSVTQNLAAGATRIIVSSGAVNLLTGSAQLTTAGHISGFVIFRHNNQEAVVPLESRNASAYLLAFDNTGGTSTGVALNAVSAHQVNVPVVVRNDSGVEIATDTITLAANGHYAFTLGTDRYPGTATIRGTIEFDTPAGAQIGALGIRIPTGVAHTYTTLPALAK